MGGRRVILGVVLAAALTFAATAGAGTAEAHGPCSCLFPIVARPGTAVEADVSAYRIVLNPPARFFRGGAGPPELASGYRADAPTTEVLRRPRPAGRAVRRAGGSWCPDDTPPGIYLVLIFDGSEGGQHATWDYLHVPDPPLDPAAGEWHEIVAALRAVLPPL